LTIEKLFSGGQTGVDRGALDAALDHSFPCGGWCPAGRKAEDGPIPERYPLTALASASYAKRTAKNVIDSDGTLVIYFDLLSGGTELTVRECMRAKKPFKLIDGTEVSSARAGELAARFVETRAIKVLNVAGPRESSYPGAASYAYRAVAGLLTLRRASIGH
jgi:hypothetical protein